MHPIFPHETFIPSRILFKKGALGDLAKEAAELGTCGMIVHGVSFEKAGFKEKLKDDLKKAGITAEFFCRLVETGDPRPALQASRSQEEPTLAEISEVIAQGRGAKAQWIAGIGGGSALDLAKAAAGLFHAKEKPSYYQEGGALTETGVPFIAVPTTAGSGSEASLNSVIINPEKKIKLSIRHKNFLACKVLLDPDLLKSLPFAVMCHSGMDAWVQAYESFISKHATWFSENLALKAIQLIGRHLVPALNAGRDEDLEGLMLGSFFSGLAFSHSRLGVIHGLAHPLGVLYNIPHGLICSVCFSPSIKLNLEAMGNQKYSIMSQAVGMDLLQKVHELQKTLKIASPFKGKPILEKEKIIRETLGSGSTAANPKTITREDIEYILNEIF